METTEIRMERVYVNTERTFVDAVEAMEKRGNPLVEPITERGRPGEINMSSIYTRLIQETGRFVERFASDLLLDIEHLKDVMEKVRPGTAQIVAIGCRRDGVDGNAFIIQRLRDTRRCISDPFVYMEHVYRRLFLIKIEKDDNDATCVTLYDATNELHKLSPGDM